MARRRDRKSESRKPNAESSAKPETRRPARHKPAARNARKIGFQQKARLIAAAARARRHSVAPYSRFKVGAALLTRRGEIITGANVESASYGLTCCAERVALFKALTDGKRDFVAVAVVARVAGGAMPCGACRQLLAEHARSARFFSADSRSLGSVYESSVRELLPHPFLALD